MRPTHFLSVLGIVTCALGACRGVLGIEERPLRGEREDASTADAGGDAVDGGSSSDAAEPLEVDSGCGHLLCEDFDDDAGLGRWQVTRTAGQGGSAIPELRLDADASTTAPRSLFFKASPLEYLASARLEKAVSLGAAAGLTCTMDLRLEALGSGWVVVAAVGANDIEASFLVNANGLTEIQETFPATDRRVTRGPDFSAGDWRSITFALTRSPAAFSVSDLVTTKTLDLTSWPATTEVSLRLGLVTGNPYPASTTPARGRVDHIRCDRTAPP